MLDGFLSNISWKEFLLFVGVTTLVYWAALVMLGKVKLKKGGPSPGPHKKKRTWRVEEEPDEANAITEPPEYDPTIYNAFPAPKERLPVSGEEKALKSLEALADKLQDMMDAQSPGISKEQLMEAIKQELARYPALNVAAFRAAINNLVIRAAFQKLNIEITRTEAESLWA